MVSPLALPNSVLATAENGYAFASDMCYSLYFNESILNML
jgi:hypothetical protein